MQDEVQQTRGAELEGIIDAGWFTRDQLAGEVVFPSPLMMHDWRQFTSDDWEVQCLPSGKAGF